MLCTRTVWEPFCLRCFLFLLFDMCTPFGFMLLLYSKLVHVTLACQLHASPMRSNESRSLLLDSDHGSALHSKLLAAVVAATVVPGACLSTIQTRFSSVQ